MKLTLDELRGMLKIDKHKLDDELEVQAHVHFQITEELSYQSHQKQSLKEELEMYDAGLLIDLRKSNVKKTVSELQAEIAVDSGHRATIRDLFLVNKNHELWEGMLEAWKQRGFALKSLADLAMSNYYNVDSTYERPAVQRREVRRRT